MVMRLKTYRYEIAVPPELEEFAQYLLRLGYKEETTAKTIEEVRAILNGRPLDTGAPSTTKRRRNAWRRYKEFLALRGE
ncbi:MAG: hypothetical protein H0Z19_11300 [Archaeoglobus sp.]|uniref:hypothetical protein n=1 Tax=Archaeoglobus sp. TaxID=1872626 RepID=UPI001E0D9B27|nr:hypothetical protein [Archaeoglobus sp.]MBO8180860.1 hypothetical protein [Archaeoglobus sp.]MBO8181033.1 hypothetical protein [Archaeoglobus sp.]